MASEGFHEDAELLTPQTKDLHRAIVSLKEELEAIDWYQQRVDATGDDALRAILAHTRDEEKEHASMVLEWIRRHDPVFDEHLRTYLFSSGPVTEHEASAKAGAGSSTEAAIGSLRGVGFTAKNGMGGPSDGPVKKAREAGVPPVGRTVGPTLKNGGAQ